MKKLKPLTAKDLRNSIHFQRDLAQMATAELRKMVRKKERLVKKMSALLKELEAL
jgi:hypothetical protein